MIVLFTITCRLHFVPYVLDYNVDMVDYYII